MHDTLKGKRAPIVAAALLLSSVICTYALAASQDINNLGPLATPLPNNSPVPKVIVISLDGATPSLIENYLAAKAFPPTSGLGLLRANGSRAAQNVTETPSLTAVSHL